MREKLNILALDPATVTGWATNTAHGTWNLKPKSYESKGMRLIKFKASLNEICKAESIEYNCLREARRASLQWPQITFKS